MSLRIVYMGTPEIARVCLERIYQDGHDIAAVYTKIDTPKNRGMKLTASPVKEFALAHEIPVIQPQTFKDETVVEELRALNPDLICVVAYGKILPQAVLDILLEKYMNQGIAEVEDIRVLSLADFADFGKPARIVKLFGGKAQYEAAIRELEANLYELEVN